MKTDSSYIYLYEHVEIYIIVKLSHCTPETSIVLYVNCISIKNILIKKDT